MAQTTLRDFLQETEDAISSGRIDAALAQCQSMLASFPESLEAQRLLGEVYLAKGNLEEALHSFDWVLTNDPENVVAYCNRAEVSERMSDFETALDCYQQAYELSRGNRQIRLEFNQLSQKIGQQGFMFSRAGLARLYMRGDLLAQALQEWEVVLASMPDRLDARTGLLETYWREGALEKAEHLANQILRDVPGCLKALLVLAHCIATRDAAQSQELLRRAGALDPDQMMARELFADLLASKPDDPFLQHLQKSQTNVLSSPAMDQSAKSSLAGLSASDANVDPLARWGEIEGWSNDTTLIKPGSEQPSGTFANGEPSWSGLNEQLSNGFSENASPSISSSGIPNPGSDVTHIAPWNTQNQPAQPDPSPGDPEPWQLLQAALNQMPRFSNESDAPPDAGLWQGLENPTSPTISTPGSDTSWEQTAAPTNGTSGTSWEQPQQESANGSGSSWAQLQQESANGSGSSWEQLQQESANGSGTSWGQPQQESTTSSGSSWAQLQQESTTTSGTSWTQPQQENVSEDSETSWTHRQNESAPPAWLSMLTQSERHQTSDLGTSATAQEPESSLPDWSEPTPITDHSSLPGWEEQLQASASGAAETEVSPPKKQEKHVEVETTSEDSGDEESFFGPAWLKSLGAELLDEEQAAANQQEEVAPQTAPPVFQVEPAATPVFEQKQEQAKIEPETPSGEYDNWQHPVADTRSGPLVREVAATYDLWNESPSEAVPAVQNLWQPESTPRAEDTWNTTAPPSTQDFWSSTKAEPAATTSDLWNTPQPEQTSLEQNAWSSSSAGSMAPGNSPESTHSAAFDSWKPYEAAINNIGDQLAQTQSRDDNRQQEKDEQNLLSTLEELEIQLRSKGFIPLEPKSLASIAQSQGQELDSPQQQIEPLYQATPEAVEPMAQPSVQPVQEQPSLTSALAELGQMVQRDPKNDYTQQHSPEPSSPTPPTQEWEEVSGPSSWMDELRTTPAAPPPTTPEQGQFETTMEPQWLRELRSTSISTPAAHTETPFQVESRKADVPSTPMFEPLISGPLPQASSFPGIAPTPAYESKAVPMPPPVPAQKELHETVKAPAARGNPFLEGELEATMKRPAVRLQALQRPTQPQERERERQAPGATPPIKTRSEVNERKEPIVPRMADPGGQSYRDRLVKGYQLQLVGNYDEAMQEYRIIIRSAPDLLGEVVSNVRALLKIAPRYATGYRVLGDAYMRQGEYLPAMEAYNKALTMAKKAKS